MTRHALLRPAHRLFSPTSNKSSGRAQDLRKLGSRLRARTHRIISLVAYFATSLQSPPSCQLFSSHAASHAAVTHLCLLRRQFPQPTSTARSVKLNNNANTITLICVIP
uniref:Uncharacterized protein n=1 Tax=Parascaris univalens TaxID=6257 RepID=A0A915AA27_PARUN